MKPAAVASRTRDQANGLLALSYALHDVWDFGQAATPVQLRRLHDAIRAAHRVEVERARRTAQRAKA